MESSEGKLIKLDAVEAWLECVAYANCGSPNTEDDYRRNFRKFLAFIDKTAEQILQEYEASTDRDFKRHYALQVRRWIASLTKGKTKGSIKTMVGAVQSICKYNDLPLGHIPQPQDHVVYHNRDISREELRDIMNVSLPRDRAFYAVMAQSGLRPDTICKLRVKHIEYERLKLGLSPVKIDVAEDITKGYYHPYFTFIAEEAIQTLHDYLKTRKALSKDSFLFVKSGTEDLPMTPSSISSQFNKTLRLLRQKGALDFEVRHNKPSELRLYTLRKFFKKHTHEAGEEFSEFWIGHKGKGVIDHYRTRDPEFHRKLYAEKAAPFLRIQLQTPSETEKQIEELRQELAERDKQLTELGSTVERLQPFLEFMESFKDQEALRLFIRAYLETDDYYKAMAAKEQGKPYKRIIQDELTEEQAEKFMDAAPNVSIGLSKAMQKALNITLEELLRDKKKKP